MLTIVYQRAASKKRYLALAAAVFVVAAAFRFYHLEARTRFLADQGRTAEVLHETLENHTLPLVGPETSLGFRQGPLYYYLLLPLYAITHGSPVSMAIPMAAFGVLTALILWYLGTRMFGGMIGTGIGLLYAASPSVVNQNIAIWNPAPVPFFTALLILAFYKIYGDHDARWFILLGAAAGAVVQFHYAAIFNTFFAFFIGFILMIREIRRGKGRQAVLWAFLGVLSAVLVNLPYLVYESSHRFVDFSDFLVSMLLPSETAGPLASSLHDALSVIFGLTGHILSVPAGKPEWLVLGILLIVPLISRQFWAVVFVLWFLLGSIPVVRYREALFEHYVYYLTVIPYFLAGYVLFPFRRVFSGYLVAAILVLLLVLPFTRGDVFPEPGDIARARTLTGDMVSLSNGRPFAFTLLSPDVTSDYHLRYFLSVQGVQPRFIYDENYPVLFVVCISDHCPVGGEAAAWKEIAVSCYEAICKSDYPKKRMNGWALSDTAQYGRDRIYRFVRSL
ncbi:glycosyltransferase family 39 protein [Patescibacteria group bacterium]|nr:glycosyltransferase family 39 protein [Patescibacteria group bacterium]